MPYKHEEEVKSVVYGYAKYSADDTVIDEVDEVYKKSEAFNEISQVFKKVTIYNTATALEVKEILDKLGDTNNE